MYYTICIFYFIGNTEEEIEEHEELVFNERRNSLSKRPKPKHDPVKKTRSNKNKRSSENKLVSTNSSTEQSTIKADL